METLLLIMLGLVLGRTAKGDKPKGDKEQEWLEWWKKYGKNPPVNPPVPQPPPSPPNPGPPPAPPPKPADTIPNFPLDPLPGKGVPYSDPYHPAVVARAQQLLSTLGRGKVQVEGDPAHKWQWVAYRKEKHGPNKIGITAYRSTQLTQTAKGPIRPEDLNEP